LDDGDELLRRCQQGDETALDALVRRYQDVIYRLAWRVLGDADLAQEATAAALVKIWERAGQWRGEASAGTWIYRLAVRTVLDTRRGRQRWWRRWSSPLPDAVADARPEPAEALAEGEQQDRRERRLREALAQLSPEDRALIHLYYFEEYGLAQIEAILNVPRATLKTRLARARQRLRDRLEKPDEAS
jgi:RNA polymerase sigma-70 factor (ECF subfamily)